MQVGILAIQGGYQAHGKILALLQIPYVEVRTIESLARCDALIIPGGESTTFLWFISQNGLWNAIIDFAKNKPIFGTCAGAILLAKNVLQPQQKSLGLIDMTIKRNSYGRQIASQIRNGASLITNQTSQMVFIRAPRIKKIASDVEILGMCEDEIVCVRQGNCMAATFHPELADDLTWHKCFLA